MIILPEHQTYGATRESETHTNECHYRQVKVRSQIFWKIDAFVFWAHGLFRNTSQDSQGWM